MAAPPDAPGSITTLAAFPGPASSDNAEPVSLQKSRIGATSAIPVVPAEPHGDTVLRAGPVNLRKMASSAGAQTVVLPPPSHQQPKPPAPRRGWLIAAIAFVVVAAVATTAVLFLRPTVQSDNEAVIGSTAAASPAEPPSGALPSTAQPPAVGPSAGVTTTVTQQTVVTMAGSVPAAVPGGPAPATTTTTITAVGQYDPLSAPRTDITCGQGYIVQVASELDRTALVGRVQQIRDAGTLPADAKWTETSTSCPIFTAQVNVLVLYSGPFNSPYDACPARLASPPDAFIKGTNQGTASSYVSCLCPAALGQVPAITAVGQQGVWVGELQRVLGTKLDYDVGPINADGATGNPGHWGTYTAETAAAVGRFQRDNGLPATEQVDGSTWAALQAANC
jgi:hypothetical protein